MKKILILFVVTVFSALFLFSCKKDDDVTSSKNTAEEKLQVISSITVDQADSLIKANAQNVKFMIIDVRTPSEFAGGHIKNARNIDYNSAGFADSLETLDKENLVYLIYCQSGNRSGKALTVMETENFKEVYNMLGGIAAWKSKGYSVEK